MPVDYPHAGFRESICKIESAPRHRITSLTFLPDSSYYEEYDIPYIFFCKKEYSSYGIFIGLRELNIYSEMLPCTQKLENLHFRPKGIVSSRTRMTSLDYICV